MKTYAAGTKKARTLFAQLSPERQQELLKQAKQPFRFLGGVEVPELGGRVIQFDKTEKEPVQVVSMMFGMDLCIDSKYVYLFADEVPA